MDWFKSHNFLDYINNMFGKKLSSAFNFFILKVNFDLLKTLREGWSAYFDFWSLLLLKIISITNYHENLKIGKYLFGQLSYIGVALYN